MRSLFRAFLNAGQRFTRASATRRDGTHYAAESWLFDRKRQSAVGLAVALALASGVAVARAGGGSATVALGSASGRAVQQASINGVVSSSATASGRAVQQRGVNAVTLSSSSASGYAVQRRGALAVTVSSGSAAGEPVARGAVFGVVSSASSAGGQAVLEGGGLGISTISGIAAGRAVLERGGFGVVSVSGSAAGQVGSIGGSDMPLGNWKARAYKRGALLVPEFDLSRGPIAEGVTGAGDYAALFGRKWALALDANGGLHLIRESAGSWGEVVPLSPLPVLSKAARHISWTFDQSARPVIAWEESGAVFVRQYDVGSGGYLIRGPFAGADPVLFNDAILLRTTASSDVVLMMLSADRSQLVARAQNSLFMNEFMMRALGGVSVLDAVVLRSNQYDVRGATLDAPFSLLSQPYTVTNNDVVSTAAFAVPNTGLLEPLVLLVSPPADQVSTAAFTTPTTGDLYNLVLERTPPTDAVSVAAFQVPAIGTLAEIVIVVAPPTDAVSVAAFQVPAIADLATVIVQISLPTDAVSVASFSVPTAGLLEVI